MHIEFASDSRILKENCDLYFPKPEILGLTGGPGFGHTGLFGNQMSSIIALEDGWRVYLTRRIWTDTGTSMELGFIDTDTPDKWPLIENSYQALVIDGLYESCSASQAFVIRNGKDFELFFWIHGEGMIRYVKCNSSDGIHFVMLNQDNPCLYHPGDMAVRINNHADGLLSHRNHLVHSKKVDPKNLLKISNDATSVSFDPASGLYQMYSVHLLDTSNAPERQVNYDNVTRYLRVIDRRTSKDGLEWTEPELVLIPDKQDRIDLQFYVMQQLKQNSRYALVAGYYPVKDQVMDLMPAVSVDGVNILRPQKPWQLRDRIPGCDWNVEMLFPGGMFEVDDWIYFSATAFNFKHNQAGKMRPEEYRQESVIMRQKSERWVGLKNSNSNSKIITAPFQYKPLKIIADDPGKVKITLISAFGNKLLAGGTLDSSGNLYFPDKTDLSYIGKWVKLAVHFETQIYNMKSR